jgi:hypothetical protein
VNFHSRALAEFWEHYDALPEVMQERADKQFALFEKNPNHPSLHFNAAGPYWSVRVSRGYRAVAYRRDNELFWFWIGPHDEYERILKG